MIQRVPIYTFTYATLAPGQYTFPFCFIIPQYAPGSFFFNENESKIKAKIWYKVKCKLN